MDCPFKTDFVLQGHIYMIQTNLCGNPDAHSHRWDTRGFPAHCVVFLPGARLAHTDRGTSTGTGATHTTNTFDFVYICVCVYSLVSKAVVYFTDEHSPPSAPCVYDEVSDQTQRCRCPPCL